MNEHRNMVLAIVLSAIVLIGWSFLSEMWLPTARPPATKIVDGKTVPVPQPKADPTADAPVAIRDRRQVLGETPRIAIETPHLAGSINLKGARLDDLVLTTHREGVAKNSPAIRLLSPGGSPGAYFASFGWAGSNVPGPETVWTPSATKLAPGSPVTLSWDNGQGQLFQIGLAVDDGYLFRVDQKVVNRGAGDIAVRPYSVLSRIGVSKDPDPWTAHAGPMGVFNGAADYDNDYSTVAEAGERRFSSRGGWIGFTDTFWLTAVIPSQASSVDAAFRHNRTSDSYQADAIAQPLIAPRGKISSYTSHLFAGAKEIELLDRYTEQLGTPLERAIDWGWFRWFMQPIFSLLNWLYAVLGNFGLAIICLTLIVRTLMFPIAQKQFKSMAAMRVLQPKMKAIQDRHKDDKARQQQEMLKLYQEEKVNPMAGCLPIVIQIPIFYALYKVLMVSVEMRHKPFVLWIKDLSAPDPLTPVNLFGFLPFTPPSFLALGVLPILLGISMWAQFKLNPPATDPVQRQVFAIMPWVLMFAMAPFAAGLQLYWTVNNVLTIIQQKWLYSRYPGMNAAPETPAPVK
ncbi:MAG TPA: membrane protein insertase YidC [Allosphingosinicella sp.]